MRARTFGAKSDLIKVGAALVEFGEGTQVDTGTIVGEVERSESLAREAAGVPSRPRGLQALPAIRALARKLR